MSEYKEGDYRIASACDKAIESISDLGVCGRSNKDFARERLGAIIIHARKELEILRREVKEKPLDETAIHIKKTFEEDEVPE